MYAKLPVVVAGGGKVYNSKKEVLFIHRNGKWDLPKGKAEKKEDMETTAIREVEEECAVNGLEILKPLKDTFHIYTLKESSRFSFQRGAAYFSPPRL